MAPEELTAAVRHGFVDKAIPAAGHLIPRIISNQSSLTMSRTLIQELQSAESFIFAVAFITPAALAALKQDLIDFQGPATIITSNYLNFNTPAVYRELLKLPGIDVYVVPQSDGFHAKGYLFRRTVTSTAIIGSSNLTISALSRNLELNVRFSAASQADIIRQFDEALVLQQARAELLNESWIERFESTYVPLPRPQLRQISGTRSLQPGDGELRRRIEPNSMQRQALGALSRLRAAGEQRALVVSATGTGKTILSALDVRNYDPKRFLFLAHREQILDSAMQEYQDVLLEDEHVFGKLAGEVNLRTETARYVFATIPSFVRALRRGEYYPDDFDYVLIDEVHRAGAKSYLEILRGLRPEFLLGMTATPERTDGFNVYELFDYNLAYEIRLQEALEQDMLVPFHYFGVTDYTMASGETVSDTSELQHLASQERVEHLIRNLEIYGQADVLPKGLIFCSRNAEAADLAARLNGRLLNGRPLRTVSLSGADSVERREAAVRQLEAGELQYILTVDVFNEGIDIPAVNQVVMLRQTQSSIVFTQQLGRGLRRHVDKDYLIVLDFIGNYANNYLIPTALFGDTSLNREQLRRRMIDVAGDPIVAGLSSINFDRISRQRVFSALNAVKLDSLANLRSAFINMKNRLGRTPMLVDFAHHDTVDPVVMGSRFGHYAEFVKRMDTDNRPRIVPESLAGRMLHMFTQELLRARRPQELLLLQLLICKPAPVTTAAFRELLADRQLDSSTEMIAGVGRILSLEWFTAAERKRYGEEPIVVLEDGCFQLSSAFRAAWADNADFRTFTNDVIAAGLHIAEHRRRNEDGFVIGGRYTRKDVCFLENWNGNEQSTLYGYKINRQTGTCPIFVTYHKSDDVSVSTRYGDAFLDPDVLFWYTKSNRRLSSPEVQAILSSEITLNLFVKKDDAEGTDFIYLGRVRPENAVETTMGDADSELPVVTMNLRLEKSVDAATYAYLLD